MDAKELGNLGEKIACEYLVKKGFNILGRNHRITFGEIDIIAQKKFRFFSNKNRPIHFIEVKTIINSDSGFFPEQHVDYKKQQKLRQLAQIWLQENKFKQDCAYQIDIIGILVSEKTLRPGSGQARNAKLHYFPNAVEDK